LNAPPPNLLLIHSDQHRADCLGCAGHPLLRTPHLDRLAREGIRFDRAYTPVPICSPERASLLTGRWPHSHRCLSIPGTETYRPAELNSPTLGERIRDCGYRTGWIGKFHQETEQPPEQLGFDTYIDEKDYDRVWRPSQGLPPRKRENGWFGEIDPHIRPDQHRLAWGADHAIGLLEAYASEDRPFFLRWDPSEPHLPALVAPGYEELYDPKAIEPWPGWGDDFRGKPGIQAQQVRTWGVDAWTWEDWKPVVNRYLGEITLLDEQIGRILARLEALGLAENTLVIYSSDHGDMCGSHGMVDKHFVMYEDVVRVPLILQAPPAWNIEPGVCDAFCTSALDISRTLLEAAGAEIPTDHAGRCLLSIARGGAEIRNSVFVEYHGCQLGSYTQRMVRNERWKYVWNATEIDELYDLANDPGELRNRIASTGLSDIKAQLRSELINWLERTGDPILNPWTRAQLAGSKP